jgi:apolipoprotein N-acyltransferase
LYEFALAILSGLLLTASFPKFGHPSFGWIALTPLLVALAAPGGPRPLRRAFLLGLVTGAVFFTGTLYWVTEVMVTYGNIQGWVAVLINAGLVAYQSAYPALLAPLIRWTVRRNGALAILAAPLAWVTMELGRTYLLSGFPWVLLGYSQATVLPIAQLASVFGVYGVSMLVATVSAALAYVVVARTPYRWVPTAIALVVVAAVAVWGSRRVATSEWTRAGDPIRVGLVQGNVDQSVKWDARRAASILEDHVRLTRQAIASGAALVIWPESSMPFFFEEDRAGSEEVRALARDSGVPILFGSDQATWRTDNGRRVMDKLFNAAYLVGADGTTAGVYRKMQLVPFGEFVPMKRLLFFAAPLVEAVSDFSAGERIELLPVGSHRISTAICYEIVYPYLVRDAVLEGSDLLTTITNDAWFGATSAPYQHFTQASMRAIEDGRYLVRAANTGISGIVDPYGRVLEQTRIYEQAVVVGTARFLRTSTFYARHGDILAYASAIATLALLITSRRRVK